MRRARIILGAALALLASSTRVSAHDQPYSYVDLRLTSAAASGTVLAHVFDLANAILVIPPDSLLSPPFAAARHAALVSTLERRLIVTADGDTLRLVFEGASEAVPDRRLLRFRFHVPLARRPAEVRVRGPLFPEDPQHESYVNVLEDGRVLVQDVLDRSRREAVAWSASPRGALAVLRTFVAQGVHHILIGPDHILFIVGLLLPGGGIRRLLRIVTAFTLAHSVTLGIAALGVFRPPARIVEPLIALSIVAIGIENLRRRNGADRRAPVAFGFGLIHGFGFAGVLAEFGLPRSATGRSLFGFNLGVELGQAAIVLAVAPALAALARNFPAASARMVRWGSGIVIAAGTWWLVERLIRGS